MVLLPKIEGRLDGRGLFPNNGFRGLERLNKLAFSVVVDVLDGVLDVEEDGVTGEVPLPPPPPPPGDDSLSLSLSESSLLSLLSLLLVILLFGKLSVIPPSLLLLALSDDSFGLLSASNFSSFLRLREEKSGLVRAPRPDPGVKIGLLSDGRGAPDPGLEVVVVGVGRGVYADLRVGVIDPPNRDGERVVVVVDPWPEELCVLDTEDEVDGESSFLLLLLENLPDGDRDRDLTGTLDLVVVGLLVVVVVVVVDVVVLGVVDPDELLVREARRLLPLFLLDVNLFLLDPNKELFLLPSSFSSSFSLVGATVVVVVLVVVLGTVVVVVVEVVVNGVV